MVADGLAFTTVTAISSANIIMMLASCHTSCKTLPSTPITPTHHHHHTLAHPQSLAYDISAIYTQSYDWIVCIHLVTFWYWGWSAWEDFPILSISFRAAFWCWVFLVLPICFRITLLTLRQLRNHGFSRSDRQPWRIWAITSSELTKNYGMISNKCMCFLYLRMYRWVSARKT